MTVFNPDNWGEALILAFLGLCFVASAVVPVWITARRERPWRAKLDEVHNQVNNNHPDRNLRVDIDKLATKLDEVQGDVHTSNAGIAHLNTRFDGLATRVDGLAARMDEPARRQGL